MYFKIFVAGKNDYPSRDVPDTTLPDTGFNRRVIYRIPDSSKH